MDILSRAEVLFARPAPWLLPVIQRYCEWATGRIRPRVRDVVAFLREDHRFQRVLRHRRSRLRLQHWIPETATMQPAPAAIDWPIPVVATVRDLADWLWLEDGDLQWFADLRLLCAEDERARHHHYRYRLIRKASGGVRLLEAPKLRLKKIQRDLLREILAKVPVHDAAHGFVPGRSAITFAAPHVGKPAILQLDLESFFPSIRQSRVQTVFRLMGYPESVADLLGGLCCSTVPRRFWRTQAELLDSEQRVGLASLYGSPHLPQGAPTSPALANLCAYRFDCRLDGLSRSWGVTYTRYADDLAFSGNGNFAQGADDFAARVGAIALEEGFAVQHRKTRLSLDSGRQRLAGLIVNQKLNVPRADYDRLKATLTNCVRQGPESQNRESHPAFRAHLLGLVSYVASVHPERGIRLRSIFDRIVWPESLSGSDMKL